MVLLEHTSFYNVYECSIWYKATKSNLLHKIMFLFSMLNCTPENYRSLCPEFLRSATESAGQFSKSFSTFHLKVTNVLLYSKGFRMKVDILVNINTKTHANSKRCIWASPSVSSTGLFQMLRKPWQKVQDFLVLQSQTKVSLNILARFILKRKD